MGLDVYLEKCADFKGMRAAQTQADEEISALWEGLDYNKLTEAQKKELAQKQQAIHERLGFTGEYDRFHGTSRIEQDSQLYPAHLFKVGYLRSSYNGSGFNSVMERKGLPSLYDIFKNADAEDDEGYVRCDWARAKVLVAEALAKYEDMQKGILGRIDAMQVAANMFDPDYGPRNEREALEVAARMLEGPRHGNSGFSCKDGDFYPEGIKVLGMIPGKDTSLRGERPCTYIIYERAEQGTQDWYYQALKVTEETIDFVLADPHPEHFHLVWSS